jgi:cytochrome c
MRWFLRDIIVVGSVLVVSAGHAQLRGHGGPVKALAISSDGLNAISGSFDTSVIRWSLSRNVAEQVLRFHDGAVNAIAYLKDGRIVTAGTDAHIAIWTPGLQQPDKVLDGHAAPIASLSVSPDGTTLASASWDRTVRLWPLNGGEPRVLEGNAQSVNGVVFSKDGKNVVSVGYDATVRIWSVNDDGETVHSLPTPLNAIAVAPDGEIVVAGANGRVYFLSPTGEALAEAEVSPTPVVAIAISPDGSLVAAAGIRGSVGLIERKIRTLVHTLVGPGLPVWSVAFFPDSRTLLTGGADRMIRRWDASSGEPVGAIVIGTPEDSLAAYAGDHGAEVFRACVACHTLSPGEGNKAGPTLSGIFGRRIATLPGYNFSLALKKLDIVWTPETVSKLFEIGPTQYTPGTKMPEQTIGSSEDRKALVDFLARATKQK